MEATYTPATLLDLSVSHAQSCELEGCNVLVCPDFAPIDERDDAVLDEARWAMTYAVVTATSTTGGFVTVDGAEKFAQYELADRESFKIVAELPMELA